MRRLYFLPVFAISQMAVTNIQPAIGASATPSDDVLAMSCAVEPVDGIKDTISRAERINRRKMVLISFLVSKLDSPADAQVTIRDKGSVFLGFSVKIFAPSKEKYEIITASEDDKMREYFIIKKSPGDDFSGYEMMSIQINMINKTQKENQVGKCTAVLLDDDQIAQGVYEENLKRVDEMRTQ